MSELQVYDQHATRYERAYAAFCKVYDLEHEKPVAPKWWSGLPWLMVPFGIIAAAGIALSAFRTAPVFGQIAEAMVGVNLAAVEAVLAVITIDVFIVASRYAHVLSEAHEGKLSSASVREWMTRGFWVAFSVAVLANIYASIIHVPVIATIKPAADLVIALAVGVCAPLLAFIAGDILGMLWVRSEAQRAELRATYRAARETYLDAREKSWNARKADYGVRIRVEAPPPTALPSASFAVHSPNNSLNGANEQEPVHSAVHPLNGSLNGANEQREHGTGSGYTKNMKAADVARDWLLTYQAEHPEVWALGTDDFHALVLKETQVSIGRTTAHNVRATLKKELGK
jgi:hypothetical protein